MVETFGGNVVAGRLDCAQRRHLLVVAAMRAESFSDRLCNYPPEEVILFVGDRDERLRAYSKLLLE